MQQSKGGARSRPRSAGATDFAMRGRDAAFLTCEIRRREAPSRRLLGHCKTGEGLATRPKTWPKRDPKSHHPDPRTSPDRARGCDRIGQSKGRVPQNVAQTAVRNAASRLADVTGSAKAKAAWPKAWPKELPKEWPKEWPKESI